MPFAMVFPGQGSQSVGMLGELAANNKIVRDTFEEASTALGYDLWHLIQNGPADDLNATHRTQPALLTAGVAVHRAWRERDGRKPVACSCLPTLQRAMSSLCASMSCDTLTEDPLPLGLRGTTWHYLALLGTTWH